MTEEFNAPLGNMMGDQKITSDTVADALVRAIPQDLLLSEETFKDPLFMTMALRFVEAMPIAVCVVSHDMKYVLANHAYVTLAGSTKPTWRGLTVQEYLPEQTYTRAISRIRLALAGERLSYYLPLPPGPHESVARTLLVNYTPCRTGVEGEFFFIMTGQDVTQLQLTEQRVVAAQRLETVGQLTAGIAHDYNNYLHVIMGSLALLELKLGSSPHAQLISRCLTATEQCAALTSQLLSFGRQQSLQPKSFNVREQLLSIIEIVRMSLPDNVELVLRLQAAEATISVDPAQFESMILNLVLNARDACRQGGTIELVTRFAHKYDDEIRTTSDPKADLVRIEVIDNGIGMSIEVANKIFEPFFTTKDRGHGTGMGLAMVYGFVKQSGGEVEVFTAPNVGTKIQVTLPTSSVSTHYQHIATLTPPSSEIRYHVLVVENHRAVLDVMVEMLQYLGHRTTTCDNADDAIRLLRTHSINVVLTDILIKGSINGLELQKLVKAEFPHVHLICMSGYAKPSGITSEAIGPDILFLSKPVKLSNLKTALQTFQKHSPPHHR